MPRALPLLLAAACAPAPQPLDLPSDLAASGVPVGVRTVRVDEHTFEVWYPADDAHAEDPGEPASLEEFFPAAFWEKLPDVTLPGLPSPAVRDAAPRPTDTRFPVVLFSHGFGAFRTQSVSLTAHLASRGYVVIAPDHPGRMVTDIAACLFDPPLEGCDLANLVPVGEDDPAEPGLEAALTWIADENEDWLDGAADLDAIGMFGHSAGGFSTAKFSSEHAEIGAALAMAGGDVSTTEAPYALLAGTCDAVVPVDSLREAWTGSPGAELVEMAGVGHMAFSDICGFGLDTLAAEHLSPRDDVNQFLLDQMLTLATDGCEGYAPPEDLACGDAYLPIASSDPLIRHLVTGWFDRGLRGADAPWVPDDPTLTQPSPP